MNVQKILKAAPAYAVPAAINLSSLMIFTRQLSLEDYGQLSLALITIEFLQGVFYQWVTTSMMRFYKGGTKPSSVVIGLHYNIITTTLLLASLLVLFFTSTFFHLDFNFVLIVVLGIIGRGISNYIQDYTRISNETLKEYTFVSLASSSCFYIPGIVCLLTTANPSILTILGWQVAGVYVFLLFHFIKNIKAILNNIRSIADKKPYIEYVKYGLPLLVVFITASMFIRVDRYIIEYNVGLQELGSYSAAFSLSNLAIGSFFIILTLPTFPEIIRRINEGNEGAAKSLYATNGNTILLVGVPIVVLSCLFNQTLCTIFFGAKGQSIAAVFPYVVVGTFLFNLKLHYFDQVFQFAKKTKPFMYLGLVIGISHLALSYKLSQVWGSRGVALSGIFLNFSSVVFIYYYSKSFFEISFNKKLIVGLGIFFGVVLSGYWLFVSIKR